MAWQDKYREGSFRGVRFFTESHQVKGGRRKQDREFAKREAGNTEDLGKKLRSGTLEIYVLGDDYFADRDALIDALESQGPGQLIHPYLGTFNAQMGEYALVETVNEGRMARFTIEYTEAGKIKFPDQVEDSLETTTLNADTAIANSKSTFEQAIDVVNKAAFVIQAHADNIAAFVDTIQAAIQSVTQPIASLTYAISELKADANDLSKLPGQTADMLAAIFDDLLSEFENDPSTVEKIIGAFVGNISDTFDPVIGTTPSRVAQKSNQDALLNFGKEIGLSNQAKAAVQVDFSSTQAALESRDAIVDGIDNISESITDDELFQSMKDLQTSITKAIPAVGVTELISYTPKITLPVLVIAYDLFGDIDKESEIIDQNQIEHPGFTPGGVEISVSAG